MNPSKVKEHLQTKTLGRRGLYFRQLTSTNEIAKGLARRGLREGAIIVAETQTSGKGRLGREWTSPEGGLWLSVMLRPNVQSRHAAKLTLLASVAVAKTISKLYGLRAEVKWPNDVLLDQKKVCGILTEGEIQGHNIDFAVLGVGINANISLKALPEHLRHSATTLKYQLKKEISRETLLCELLKETEFYYDLFGKGEFEAILSDWRRLASFLGSIVEITGGEETVRGLATDIDENGALVIRLEDQTVQRVTSGDMRIIRKEHPEFIDE